MAYISRANAEALIDQQIANEIIQNLPAQSRFLQLARPMPRMTSNQMKIPVLTGLATAGFVSGDTGYKPTSNLTWDKVYITAEELAVIIPVPEAVIADASYDMWAEIRPRITEAFGKAIDAAAFFGTNKPESWPTGIVPGAIAAGNVVLHTPNGDLYQEIMGVNGLVAKVEEKGVTVNGFMGALELRAKLRGTVDNNRQPIFHQSYSNGNTGAFPFDLGGQPIGFPENGAWNAEDALLVAGDFSYARYAIRQDITWKILDQAVLTDGNGNVVLNLAQQDCVAIRAVMRIGWALPKPVNAVSGTDYFPFAVLKETDDTIVDAFAFNVTKPVKGQTPQSTHAAGTGYTAAITWNPTAATFAASTAYTATVTFTAADGYIMGDTIDASDFTGLPGTTDATSVAIARTSDTAVVVTVVYKPTAA